MNHKIRLSYVNSINLPVSLAQGQGLPGGVVENTVVSEEVDHPRVEGFESDKPLPEIMEKSDEDLDGRLVSVLLKPTRVADLAMSLHKKNSKIC